MVQLDEPLISEEYSMTRVISTTFLSIESFVLIVPAIHGISMQRKS